MPRTRTPAFAAALLLTGLAGAAILAAQPAPGEDRRRAVGDWLIEDVAEEDGGRIVRMTRTADDYSLEYHVSFWRGNARPNRGASAQRLTCLRGGEEGGTEAADAAQASALRARLADYLAACEASPQEAEAALEGFERAFALASAWAEEAEAATAAEAAAIANYGMEMTTNANLAMDMAMDTNMIVDADAGMETNSGVGPQPQ